MQQAWSAGFGLLTLVLVRLFAPVCPGNPNATGRRELAAFSRSQVWLTLLIGAIGFGGIRGDLLFRFGKKPWRARGQRTERGGRGGLEKIAPAPVAF